jgi:hypothetical protein
MKLDLALTPHIHTSWSRYCTAGKGPTYLTCLATSEEEKCNNVVEGIPLSAIVVDFHRLPFIVCSSRIACWPEPRHQMAAPAFDTQSPDQHHHLPEIPSVPVMQGYFNPFSIA